MDERLQALEAAFATLVAKQAATEIVINTLMAFIKAPQLLAEVALQKAADQEADAMQQDGSAPELLQVFLAEIDAWQTKLQAAGCMTESGNP